MDIINHPQLVLQSVRLRSQNARLSAAAAAILTRTRFDGVARIPFSALLVDVGPIFFQKYDKYLSEIHFSMDASVFQSQINSKRTMAHFKASLLSSLRLVQSM